MNKLFFISLAFIIIFGLSACDEKTTEAPESDTMKQSTIDSGSREQSREQSIEQGIEQKKSEINSLKQSNSTENNNYQSIPEKNMN